MIKENEKALGMVLVIVNQYVTIHQSLLTMCNQANELCKQFFYLLSVFCFFLLVELYSLWMIFYALIFLCITLS